MSHTRKRTRARSFGRITGTTFATSLTLGIALVLVLGFALLVIVGQGNRAAGASNGPTQGTPTGVGHVKGWCGNNQVQPACPAVNPGWFSVTSESPNVIAAAIANSSNFAEMKGRYGYVSLDVPVIVHAYGAHTGMDYYDDDHWVVSVRNASGRECGVFDFVYDRTHLRMRFSSFGYVRSEDPHSYQAFPYIASSVAMAQLRRQSGLGVIAGTQPQLIFFPIDPRWRDVSSPLIWLGGGAAPLDPIWHIVGSDGHDYFVGTDLHVYTQKDLPIAQGQP